MGAAVFTVPVVVASMVAMLLPAFHATVLARFFMGGGGLLFSIPVQFGAGARFYRTGFAELRHRSPGMSTLVMLGSSAAFFYSVRCCSRPASSLRARRTRTSRRRQAS